MGSTIITIISAVIIFGLLIMMHEFGHFFVAKSVGIKVNEFSVGMGPVLLQRKKGETDYSVRALPIGGFVKMEGEDENSEDERSFTQKPIWAKILVTAAGSFMNFIFAMILVMVLMYANGVPSTVVGQLVNNGPAKAAGIINGDKIVQIDDKKINKWEDITDAVSKSTGGKILITVERNGQTKQLTTVVIKEKTGRKVIGIYPQYKKDLVTAVKNGFVNTFVWTGAMLHSFVGLITGAISTKEVVGPIGIINVVGQVANTGQILNLIGLTAMISLNLAILNLLPIPALDGGRLLFLVVQGVIGRKLDPEKEGFIHFIGFVFLIGIMILVTFKDIKTFIFPWISRWF